MAATDAQAYAAQTNQTAGGPVPFTDPEENRTSSIGGLMHLESPPTSRSPVSRIGLKANHCAGPNGRNPALGPLVALKQQEPYTPGSYSIIRAKSPKETTQNVPRPPRTHRIRNAHEAHP